MDGKERHIEWEREWLEGRISMEEARTRASEVEEILTLLKSGEKVASFDVSEVRGVDQVWQDLRTKISANEHTKVIPMSRRYWMIGIAASFILAIGALFLFPFSEVNQSTINTSLGEVKTINLPDGSFAHMNAESKISYLEKAWKDERSLDLEGEAFFEVEKGSRFTVSTPFGSVEVLGTSFNVRARNGILIVSCKTGKVRVSSPTGESSQIITPGQSVVAKGGKVTTPEEINIDQVDIWRAGEFYFESVALTEVLEELERQFEVTLKYDEAQMKNRIVGGLYFSNKDLNEALQLISIAMNLKYEIEGKVVTLSSKAAPASELN